MCLDYKISIFSDVNIFKPDIHSKMTLPYIYMSTAQGDLVPWLASQTDLLFQDWEVYLES